jgi:O-antigen ligase
MAASGSTTKPASRVTWSGILAVAGTVLLAGLAIALGLAIGKKMTGEEWTILLTAAGFGVYVAIAVIDVRHAFLFWIVTAPFARFIHLEIELGRRIPNLTLNRLMVGALLVLFLAQVTIHRRNLARFHWADVCLVAFLGASFLSLPISVLDFSKAFKGFLDLLVVPALVYFLAKNLTTNRRELKSVLLAMMFVGVYLALLATHEQLTGVVWFYPEDRSVIYSRDVRRVVGLLGNPAFIALIINMAVPWVFYLFRKRGRRPLLRALVILALFAGIYLCMNRSGWASLVVSLLVMAVLVPQSRRYFIITLVVIGILAVVYGAVILASPAVQERLTAEGPIEYRVQTWDVAWRMIKDHPSFGVGWESFSNYYTRYAVWDVYLIATPTPHNTFLWVALMGGAVALVPFVLFLASLFSVGLGVYVRAMVSGDPLDQRGLAGTFLACLVSVLVPAMTTDILSGAYNNIIMFLFIGAFLGTISQERAVAAVQPAPSNALGQLGSLERA